MPFNTLWVGWHLHLHTLRHKLPDLLRSHHLELQFMHKQSLSHLWDHYLQCHLSERAIFKYDIGSVSAMFFRMFDLFK